MRDLTIRDFDGEPRMRDMDIAEALEFERPRDVRKIIDRNMDDLLSFGICATMALIHPGAGRPGTEYWLNEEQALFLCTRSEAKGAVALTKQMVMVFAAWRNGRLDPPRHGGASIDAMREMSLREAELWLSMVRETRILAGPVPALRLWSQSPLPPIDADPDTGDVMEVDEIRAFLAARCIVTGRADDFVSARDLIDALNHWLVSQGLSEMGQRAASLRLKALAGQYRDPETRAAYRPAKRDVTGYRGLRLRPLE